MKRSFPVLLFLSVFALCAAESQPAVPARPEFSRAYLERASELLALLEKEQPALFRKLTSADADRAVLKLLDVTGSGTAAGTPEKITDSLKIVYRPKMLASGNLLYCRIGFPGEGQRAEIERVFKGKTAPSGVILDLRSASGGAFDDYRKLFAVLTKQYPGIPAAVLVSGKTSGAPELAARYAVSERHAVTLGAPTAGRPFERKAVPFHGITLLIPQPPAGLPEAEKVYAPYRPMIEVQPFPAAEDRSLPSAEAERKDSALFRACDLLTALHSLHLREK